jgi:hypothetical protein
MSKKTRRYLSNRLYNGGEKPTGRKRPGSRLFLALALLAAVAAALFLGSSVMDTAAGMAGLESGKFRLVLKVVGFLVALPAAFYLVERFFLSRSRNR